MQVTTLIALALILWLALVLTIGTRDGYVTTPGHLPLPIFVGVTVPIATFLLTFRLWPSFRRLILSLDLVAAATIQAWRFGGLGILALYAYGRYRACLRGLPDWVDMAIGASAVWVAWLLSRRPVWAIRRAFVMWNLLGILDLVVAVGMGAVVSVLALETVGEMTTLPMTQMPLVMVPGFLVPMFVMLHLTALLQVRKLWRFESQNQEGLTP
jgi:hypothetical protein